MLGTEVSTLMRSSLDFLPGDDKSSRLFSSSPSSNSFCRSYILSWSLWDKREACLSRTFSFSSSWVERYLFAATLFILSTLLILTLFVDSKIVSSILKSELSLIIFFSSSFKDSPTRRRQSFFLLTESSLPELTCLSLKASDSSYPWLFLLYLRYLPLTVISLSSI